MKTGTHFFPKIKWKIYGEKNNIQTIQTPQLLYLSTDFGTEFLDGLRKMQKGPVKKEKTSVSQGSIALPST